MRPNHSNCHPGDRLCSILSVSLPAPSFLSSSVINSIIFPQEKNLGRFCCKDFTADNEDEAKRRYFGHHCHRGRLSLEYLVYHRKLLWDCDQLWPIVVTNCDQLLWDCDQFSEGAATPIWSWCCPTQLEGDKRFVVLRIKIEKMVKRWKLWC